MRGVFNGDPFIPRDASESILDSWFRHAKGVRTKRSGEYTGVDSGFGRFEHLSQRSQNCTFKGSKKWRMFIGIEELKLVIM